MDSIIYYLQSTMLIERLFGVGLYCIVLGYFYNKVQHAKSRRGISKLLNQYLIILMIMAFFYIPGTSSDLYRWRLLSEPWKDMSFQLFWKSRVVKSSTPIGYLLIYLCQSTSINGLLPMICAFGFFSNVFHIIKSELNRNRSNDSLAVILLFTMSTGVFLEVISGVRFMLSISIVLRFIYDEMYEGRGIIRSIPFYIISALIHNGSIPLIGLRIICLTFEKKQNVILTACNYFIAITLIVVSFRFGNDYLESTFAKADTYTSNNIYSYSWEYAIAFLVFAVVLLCLISFRKKYPTVWRSEAISLRYLIPLLVGEILFINTYSIFHRYITVCMIVSIPFILSYLNCEEVSRKKNSRSFIVLMALLILILSCVRGNLCGYKFFLL